jgi:transposase
MWLAPSSLKVFALRGATDLRKRFAGLAGIVETQLAQQVESGHLFLFFNRRRDRVKALYFVGDGLVIFYKRLERGTFELPSSSAARSDEGSAGIEMRWSDLALLLEGIELSSVRRRRWWRRAPQSA